MFHPNNATWVIHESNDQFESCSWDSNNFNLFMQHLRLCTTCQCPVCKQFLMPTHLHRQTHTNGSELCHSVTHKCLKRTLWQKAAISNITHVDTKFAITVAPISEDFLDCLWNMSHFLCLFVPLTWNFKALHSSRSTMYTLCNATILLASACHMGHTNKNHEKNICKLDVGLQDEA